MPTVTKTKIKATLQQTALVGIAAVAIGALLGTFTASFAVGVTPRVKIAATTGPRCANSANIACGKTVAYAVPAATSRGYLLERLTDGNSATFTYASGGLFGYEVNLGQATPVAEVRVTWGKWGLTFSPDGKSYMQDYYVYALVGDRWELIEGSDNGPYVKLSVMVLPQPVIATKIRITSGWGLQADHQWGTNGFHRSSQLLGVLELEAYATPAQPTSAVELLSDGSFEAGVSTYRNDNLQAFTAVTTYPRIGSKAAKLTFKRYGVTWGGVARRFTVGTGPGQLKPGTSYQLSSWIRLGKVGKFSQLASRAVLKNVAYLGANVGTRTDTEWHRSVVYFVTPTQAEITANPAWASIDVYPAWGMRRVAEPVEAFLDDVSLREGRSNVQLDASFSPLPLPLPTVGVGSINVVLGRLVLDAGGSSEDVELGDITLAVQTQSPAAPTNGYGFRLLDERGNIVTNSENPTVSTPGGKDTLFFSLEDITVTVPKDGSRVLTVVGNFIDEADGGSYRVGVSGTSVSDASGTASGSAASTASAGKGGTTSGVGVNTSAPADGGGSGDGTGDGGGTGGGGSGSRGNGNACVKPHVDDDIMRIVNQEAPTCDKLTLPDPWPGDNSLGVWLIRTFKYEDLSAVPGINDPNGKKTCEGEWPSPNEGGFIGCEQKIIKSDSSYSGYFKAWEATEPVGGPTCTDCCVTSKEKKAGTAITKAIPFNPNTHKCCSMTSSNGQEKDADVKVESYVIPKCDPVESDCNRNAPANCGDRIEVGVPLSDGCCPYGDDHGGKDGKIDVFIGKLCADTDCKATITATDTACHNNEDSDHVSGCAVDFVNISGCKAIKKPICKKHKDAGGFHWHCNVCK